MKIKRPDIGFKCDCCGNCCRLIGLISSELDRGDLVCKYLREDNLCDIYEERPFICNVNKIYQTCFSGKVSRKDFLDLTYKSCEDVRRFLKNQEGDN